MTDSTESQWLRNVVERRDGFESEAVDRFARRLMLFADQRLPTPLKRRVDADDVVQSVFRSFFTRHRQGQFDFAESDDVWRLLAAMTYRKLMRTIRHHRRQQRDYHREKNDTVEAAESHNSPVESEPTPASIAVMMETLSRIMERLPDVHQQILSLRLENYSIRDIADRMQVSMRTVNRALESVRQIAYEMIDADRED